MAVIGSKPPRIPERLYFRIGQVSKLIGVKLFPRDWRASSPPFPRKKSRSGQRVYKRGDVETIVLIKQLLYEERYNDRGRQAQDRRSPAAGRAEGGQAGLSSPCRRCRIEQAGGAARVAEILGLIQELKALMIVPVSDLFRF